LLIRAFKGECLVYGEVDKDFSNNSSDSYFIGR